MSVLPQLESELLEAHARLAARRRPLARGWLARRARGVSNGRVSPLAGARTGFAAGVRAVPILVAVAVSVAVVVGVLLVIGHGSGTRASLPLTGGPHPGLSTNPSSSVVVDCADTVSGQLASGWHSPRSGTVVAGPISWLYLRQNADRVAISKSRFVEALAVVEPGRGVTVSIPTGERGRLALDYTDVAPRRRFYLSQGASSVTFRPCAGPAGKTQFEGGFIVARAQCAEVTIQPVGTATRFRRFIPLGRSCRARRTPSNTAGRTVAAPACKSELHDGVLPTWARAGFSERRPRMPYVLGTAGRIAAIPFASLDSPPAAHHNNKILWVSRVATHYGHPLRIEAQRMAGTRRLGSPVARRVSGGPGPSIINLPSPGCWRFTLRWSGSTDTLDLHYNTPG